MLYPSLTCQMVLTTNLRDIKDNILSVWNLVYWYYAIETSYYTLHDFNSDIVGNNFIVYKYLACFCTRFTTAIIVWFYISRMAYKIGIN